MKHYMRPYSWAEKPGKTLKACKANGTLTSRFKEVNCPDCLISNLYKEDLTSLEIGFDGNLYDFLHYWRKVYCGN